MGYLYSRYGTEGVTLQTRIYIKLKTSKFCWYFCIFSMMLKHSVIDVRLDKLFIACLDLLLPFHRHVKTLAWLWFTHLLHQLKSGCLNDLVKTPALRMPLLKRQQKRMYGVFLNFLFSLVYLLYVCYVFKSKYSFWIGTFLGKLCLKFWKAFTPIDRIKFYCTCNLYIFICT